MLKELAVLTGVLISEVPAFAVSAPKQGHERAIWLKCSVTTRVRISDAYSREKMDREFRMGSSHEADGHTYTNILVFDEAQRTLWSGEGGHLVPWRGEGFSISSDRIWLVRREDGSVATKDEDEDLEYIDLPNLAYGILKQTITVFSDETEYVSEEGDGACQTIEPITPESEAFDAAATAQTSAAYREYLAAFPHGAHAAEVRRRLADQAKVEKDALKITWTGSAKGRLNGMLEGHARFGTSIAYLVGVTVRCVVREPVWPQGPPAPIPFGESGGSQAPQLAYEAGRVYGSRVSASQPYAYVFTLHELYATSRPPDRQRPPWQGLYMWNADTPRWFPFAGTAGDKVEVMGLGLWADYATRLKSREIVAQFYQMVEHAYYTNDLASLYLGWQLFFSPRDGFSLRAHFWLTQGGEEGCRSDDSVDNQRCAEFLKGLSDGSSGKYGVSCKRLAYRRPPDPPDRIADDNTSLRTPLVGHSR